jgi:hypothetical protein
MRSTPAQQRLRQFRLFLTPRMDFVEDRNCTIGCDSLGTIESNLFGLFCGVDLARMPFIAPQKTINWDDKPTRILSVLDNITTGFNHPFG